MLLCMYGAELAEHILQQFAAKKKKKVTFVAKERKKEKKNLGYMA